LIRKKNNAKIRKINSEKKKNRKLQEDFDSHDFEDHDFEDHHDHHFDEWEQDKVLARNIELFSNPTDEFLARFDGCELVFALMMRYPLHPIGDEIDKCLASCEDVSKDTFIEEQGICLAEVK